MIPFIVAAVTHVRPPVVRHAQHAAPGPETGAYGLYDSTTPSSLPAERPAAVYSNGSYAASPSDYAHHVKHGALWIDTSGSNPHAQVLDVEPGDASPSAAGSWAAQAERIHPDTPTVVYTMRSEFRAVRESVDGAHAKNVKFWIADPTGTPHLVPGSSATQWYWGKSVDISWTASNFWS